MNFEIIDHNITSNYVTYIVDLWEGSKDDLATTITCCIGTWHGPDLENEQGEAFDPDFSQTEVPSSYGSHWYGAKPRPLMWQPLEVVKKGDEDVKRHRDAHERLVEQNGHVPYAWRDGASSYDAFLGAIDAVAANYEDEEAWKTIDQWRERQLRHDERG